MLTCVLLVCTCWSVLCDSEVIGYYMGWEVLSDEYDAMEIQIATAIPIELYHKGKVIIGQPSMLGANINDVRGTQYQPNCKTNFNPSIWPQRNQKQLPPKAVEIIATLTIHQGDELFMSYGARSFWP